ncbi:MAG: YigZ family protein [Lachnospiraceae bacterium]
MIAKYRTIYQGGEAELLEKKSRFIGIVHPIETEEDALHVIERIKHTHGNATHHCYAYVLGEQMELQRCSDDGEPSKTAGKPILDVLLGEDIHNTIIVVVRYFGGTLLGTGGLVRAYTGAAKAGLEVSQIITKHQGTQVTLRVDYTELGKVQYLLGQRGIQILESTYTDSVVISVIILAEEAACVCNEIMEGTNGKAEITKGKTCYFTELQGKIQIFTS